MSALILKDLIHHARIWVWSLLVAATGATLIGAITISLNSAMQWSRGQENSQELIGMAEILASNLISYIGLATAAVLASTLALTVAAQQRTHALWKVLGIPGTRIARVLTGQVALVGVIGGVIGSILAPAVVPLYLRTWQEFNVYPADMPVVIPLYGPALTIAVTTLFCVLGGRGAAKRAARVPEMQALREATAPSSRTRVWQWVVAALLVFALIMVPISQMPDDQMMASGGDPGLSPAEEEAMLEEMNSPAGRASAGGAMGLILTMAALCVPAWTLRPLLVAWTRMVPIPGAAWFAARANALHRSAISLTTITPFAIAVGMTGTVYSTVGASQALGGEGSVSGFMSVGVPIFIVSGVGGVANIAMVGATRRQEGALLGVLGATRATVLRSTVLEGAIYAITGILFGLLCTLFAASAAALLSGGGIQVLLRAIPLGALAPMVPVCLMMAVATTWIPAVLDRRPALERLRQPV